MDKRWIGISVVIALVGCASTPNYAPVTDISNIEPIPKSGAHAATRGETLYEVAWRYGLDYRDVAARNKMRAPYVVKPGQVLVLRSNKKTSSYKSPAIFTAPTSLNQFANQPIQSTPAWVWPAQGRVIGSFSGSNKGLNIANKVGTPILAAAAGKVVYCGNGLRGYGNLIILKHNSVYLSAYAHNKINLVHEGQWVKKGQKIAEMGNSGSRTYMLHFEIRRAGQPVNPITMYPKIAL